MNSSKQPVRIEGLYCIRETPCSYEVSKIKFCNVIDAKILKTLVTDSDLSTDTVGFVVIPIWLAESCGFKYERMDNTPL